MTPPETANSTAAKKPFWKWRTVRILGSLVVIWLLLVHLVIPLGSKLYLQNWLLDNGADSHASDYLGTPADWARRFNRGDIADFIASQHRS